MNSISEPAERTDYELNQSTDTCDVSLLHITMSEMSYSHLQGPFAIPVPFVPTIVKHTALISSD